MMTSINTFILTKNSFYLLKTATAIILLWKTNAAVYHTTQKHVTKVMFLSAVFCPRIIPLTGELWDGKLGIWAFAKTVEAKQLLKNQSKGTIE